MTVNSYEGSDGKITWKQLSLRWFQKTVSVEVEVDSTSTKTLEMNDVNLTRPEIKNNHSKIMAKPRSYQER